MLKFDEIASILTEIKSITNELAHTLNSTDDNQTEIIKSLFDSREILLKKAQGFKLSELPQEYSDEQKQYITNLLDILILEDKSNLDLLNKKVEDTRNALVNLQSQKSVLIYSKS